MIDQVVEKMSVQEQEALSAISALAQKLSPKLDIKEASVNPENRITLKDKKNTDDDVEEALPYNNRHIFFNRGHSRYVYDQCSSKLVNGKDYDIFEVVVPAGNDGSPARLERFLRLNTEALVSNPLLKLDSELKTTLLDYINQEIINIGFSFLNIDNINTAFSSHSPTDEKAKRMKMFIITQARTIMRPHKTTQLQAIRNFFQSSKSSGILFDSFPIYETAITNLDKSEQVAAKLKEIDFPAAA